MKNKTSSLRKEDNVSLSVMNIEKKEWQQPQIIQLPIKKTLSWTVFEFTENEEWYGFLGTPS